MVDCRYVKRVPSFDRPIPMRPHGTPRIPASPTRRVQPVRPSTQRPGQAGSQGLCTVRRGDTGLGVAYCQNLQNARLADKPLWVDGIFGPKTDQRVRRSQRRKTLAVDRVVGQMTWARLGAGPPPIRKRPQRPAPYVSPHEGL